MLDEHLGRLETLIAAAVCRIVSSRVKTTGAGKARRKNSNPFDDAQPLREEGLQFPSLNTALLLTERVMLP